MKYSAWERAVLLAYVRRALSDSPDHHPPRAVRIYRRWEKLIATAFTNLNKEDFRIKDTRSTP